MRLDQGRLQAMTVRYGVMNLSKLPVLVLIIVG